MGSNLKKRIILVSLFTFTGSLCYAAPSSTMSIPNSFSPNTTIQSSQTNSNNNEISTKYNAHTHTDITQVGTITTGGWNGTAISTQYGGTGQDFSAVASGALIYFNGTGTTTTLTKPASGSILYLNANTQAWSTIPQGTNGQILVSGGASANPSFKSAGKVVQVVNTETGAMSTGTTTMSIADSIPTNTQGDQYMSLAITPTSSTNTLKIDIVFNCAQGVDASTVIALFQDTTANALAATRLTTPTANSSRYCVAFTHYMTAGTTSSTTFKVRAGPTGAGTLTFNGAAGSRELGGVIASSITITEYLP